MKIHPMRYCIVTMFLLMLLAGNASAGTGLQVSPDTSNVLVDDTFQIQIYIDASINSLMGYDIKVAFDSSVVEVISVDEGSLPGSGGVPTFFHWFDAGLPSDTVLVNGAVLGTTVDGPGVLFTITFKALRVGTTPVSFIRYELRDGVNVVISHVTTDGYIVVDAAIPVRTVTWGEIKNLYR